jgi:polysaccharide biosynthesis/export protein
MIRATLQASRHTMLRISLLLVGAFVSLLCLTACGSNPTNAAASQAVAATADYRIGPGDALNLYVWNHPELSRDLPVRPDGKISAPLIEDLEAAGKTPSQLARDIETRLAEYVRSPRVNIIVTTATGTYGDQIRVVGQAANPQALPYRNGMTVLDVMIAVGGLGEFAAGNRAKIIRRGEGKLTEIRVRLTDLIKNGDITANLPVVPGDVLIIPESRF